MCYVQFAVRTLAASLRACLALLGMANACMHILKATQIQSWCADLLGRTLVEATNEILPYLYRNCVRALTGDPNPKVGFFGSISGPIRDPIWSSIWGPIWDPIWVPIWGPIWAPIRAPDRVHLGSSWEPISAPSESGQCRFGSPAP